MVEHTIVLIQWVERVEKMWVSVTAMVLEGIRYDIQPSLKPILNLFKHYHSI